MGMTGMCDDLDTHTMGGEEPKTQMRHHAVASKIQIPVGPVSQFQCRMLGKMLEEVSLGSTRSDEK